MGFLDDLKSKAEVLGDKAKDGLQVAKDKAAGFADVAKDRADPPPLAEPLGSDPLDAAAPYSVPEPVHDGVASDSTGTFPDTDEPRPA